MTNGPDQQGTEYQFKPSCWREGTWVCDHFQDNDQGICLTCGHYSHCHEDHNEA